MSELAKRVVACKGWRWIPGMLTDHGRVCGAGYLVSDDVDEVGQSFVDCTDTIDDWSNLLPDLEDPATVGCLLALVREAWRDPKAHIAPMTGYCWIAVGVGRSQHFFGDTEAEALVVALEAAPGNVLPSDRCGVCDECRAGIQCREL